MAPTEKTLLVLAAFAAFAACARGRGDTSATPPTSTAAPSADDPTADPAASDPVQAQIDAGARLYGAHCASCHGDAGQGGRAPALVGKGALPGQPPEGREHRTMTFATVADVHAFVRDAMPPGDPAAVGETDAWAIVAFDLSANGIQLDAPLGPEAAATIEIPAEGL